MSLYCEQSLMDTAERLPPTYPEIRLPPPRPEDRLCPPPRSEDPIPFPVTAGHRLPPPQSLTDPQGPQLQSAYRDERLPPPPRPEDRLQVFVATADRRRLDLQAALTKAGIAPAAGDAAAVRTLAQLDEATVTAVIGWIGAAADGAS